MWSSPAECVVTLIRKQLPAGEQPRHIEFADSLSSLGISSLLVIAIVLEAAQRLDLDLAGLDEAANGPETVGDLIEMIERVKLPQS